MSDDITKLLQREIELSRNDIEMRTKLVRALAAYNQEIREARDRLFSEVISAFDAAPPKAMRPSLDDLQNVMNQWQRQH